VELVPVELKEKEINNNPDVLIAYLGFLASYSDTSKLMVKSSLNKFYEFLKLINLDISAVDQNVINLYMDYLDKKNLSNGTFNLNVSYLKSFLQHIGMAFKYKTKRMNNYENVKLISEDDFKKTLVYIKEKMNTAKPDRHWKYLRDFILFNTFYMTGLRKNEVRWMKHKDVFIEAGKPMYKTIIKGGKEIKKKFPVSVYALIQKLKKLESKSDDEYIFTSKNPRTGNDPISHSTINRMFNVYYQRATGNTETVTVHSIRNISGLAVQLLTKDIYITKDHLNHSLISTTDVYLEKVRKRSDSPYAELEKRLTN
jgi:site-specific recombinase XerD